MAELIRREKHNIILSIFAVLVLLYFIFDVNLNKTEAAQVTNRSATLSTTTPSASTSGNNAATSTTNIMVQFTINDSFTNSSTLTIDFPDNWITTSTIAGNAFAVTDASDYDISTSSNTTEITINASTTCDGAAGDTRFEISEISAANVFTFTHCNATELPLTGEVFNVEIGTNATTSATGDSQLGLPEKSDSVGTADIATITIGGTFGGSGDILVALIEGVTVSVTVAESLSFAVAGITNANCSSHSGLSTLGGNDSTSGAVGFGNTAVTDTFLHGCQQLTLSTNASGGFSVTSHEDDVLRSTSTSDTIPDTTCEGACTEIIADEWTTAGNNGLGHTCVNGETDGNGSMCNTEYTATGGSCGSLPCYKQFATSTENRQPLLTSTAATSSAVSLIEFKLSIDGAQAAGDYANTIYYVATPTF